MDAQLEMHTKQRWVFNDRGQEQSHFPSRHESRHKYSDDKLTGEAQYNNSPQCCQIICSCSVDIFAPATVTTPTALSPSKRGEDTTQHHLWQERPRNFLEEVSERMENMWFYGRPKDS